jgi:pSer/pThr/pTyr-binding forkhead associated (FHA) protein
MNVKLVTFTRKGGRKDFTIKKSPTIVGRNPDADIRIPIGDVSRSHCKILVEDGVVTVSDLGSSNGTFVNDEPVKKSQLNAGDAMRVGPVEFTVQIDGVPKDFQPRPRGAASSAAADTATKVVPPSASPGDRAVEDLEELSDEDLSDFDFDEIVDSDGGGFEEIDDLEEIDESDLIPDDDSDKP